MIKFTYCLTMGFLEERKLFQHLIPLNFDETTANLVIIFFYRYVDDGFNFLPKTVAPDVFLNVMNIIHPAIYKMQIQTLQSRFKHCRANTLSIKVVQNVFQYFF